MKFIENVKNYSKDLIEDESGMELLQVAVIVALAAGLISIIAWLFTVIGNKISDAAEDVDNANITPGSQSGNPWNSGGATNP